jgi:K+-sensing histidine kinase KdpD
VGQISVGANTSNPYPLPDVVSRAFLWLTVGSVLILLLTTYCFYSIGRLRRVARIAGAMLTDPSRTFELQRYRSDRDEVGSLARIIFVLARKFHSLGRRLAYEQYNSLKAEEERLKWRQAALEAIGHEIKSPLQSLLTMHFKNSSVHVKLTRMSRAVEAIYHAASVESGLSSGQVVITTGDLSAYLADYVKNLRETGAEVAYGGSETGVLANFDPINLEQVLDHVLDNARRLKADGTVVQITLSKSENSVLVSIFNHGSKIEGDPEQIFQYGASQSLAPENLGQGLFASRACIRAMKGSISARNEGDGVALLIELPGVKP